MSMTLTVALGILMVAGGIIDSTLRTSGKSIPLHDAALVIVGALLIGVWAVDLLLSNIIGVVPLQS